MRVVVLPAVPELADDRYGVLLEEPTPPTVLFHLDDIELGRSFLPYPIPLSPTFFK